MKMKHRLYIAALACTTLLAVSCGKEHTDGFGEGCLKMSIELSGEEGTRSTRADDFYDPSQNSVLRIYNADNQLIRKYAPADECPEYLYLIAGSYKAAYQSSDGSVATWDHLSYAGEQEFEIRANDTETVTLKAPILNSGVRVTFDQTIYDKFADGFSVYVSITDEYSYDDAAGGRVPALCYDKDRDNSTGFFLMPEGSTRLCWGFRGNLRETGAQVRMNSNTGNRAIIPQPGMLYSLRFSYSKTPDGSLAGINVQVEEEGEIFGSTIFFSPQPTFSGQGFSIGSVKGYTGGDLKVDVSAIAKLSTITLNAADRSYTLCEGGAAVDCEGLVYEAAADGTSGVITLSADFLAKFGGGIHAIELIATDSDHEEGKATLRIAVQGLAEVTATDCDLWNNRAKLRAIVTDEAASQVTIRYREAGTVTWTDLKATAGDNYTYTAEVTPSWSESKNENNFTVYTLKTGIVANRSYEYKMLVDGREVGSTALFTTTTTQTIPNGTMEGSLSCFSTSNGNSTSWGSGNIATLAPSLCTAQTFAGMGGAQCAKLQATNQVTYLAAGNLFLGTFNRSGMNGTVAFGQPYTWLARPAALTFKLHAKLGTVNYNNHNGPLPTGSQDQATVYVAIVDWRARHGVTSGTSAPSGMWSAANGPDAVSEGKVLGYGILDIKESTDGDRMVETTIPIRWYDRENKPSGAYTLVIACSTSTYGDYMNGCNSNTLYVDDFEWAY